MSLPHPHIRRYGSSWVDLVIIARFIKSRISFQVKQIKGHLHCCYTLLYFLTSKSLTYPIKIWIISICHKCLNFQHHVGSLTCSLYDVIMTTSVILTAQLFALFRLELNKHDFHIHVHIYLFFISLYTCFEIYFSQQYLIAIKSWCVLQSISDDLFSSLNNEPVSKL